MPKIKRRIPSGRIIIKEKRKRVSVAKCANCGKILHGVPRLQASKMKKLAKSKKRPNRPYAGYLCSRCVRELFRERIRSI